MLLNRKQVEYWEMNDWLMEIHFLEGDIVIKSNFLKELLLQLFLNL